MTDTTVMTPAEIDQELSTLWSERAKVNGRLANSLRLLARGSRFQHHERDLNAAEQDIACQEARLQELREAAQPFEVEFIRRGGWNRYFLVDNTGGHVHRGMNCTTCFTTTTYSWLIDLADCDEDAMIEEWGEMACTICFPSAPANPRFSEPSKRDAAARAERAAEKAARDAAKAAKAINAEGELRVPDGITYTNRQGLQVPRCDIVRTKVAARNLLSNQVQSIGWYGDQDGRYMVGIRVLVEALTAAGMDPADTIRKAAKKVQGRVDAERLIEEVGLALFTFEAGQTGPERRDRTMSDTYTTEWMMAVIHGAYNIGTEEQALAIYALQDGYGEVGYVPMQGLDWSGIRDSTPEAIRAMYDLVMSWGGPS